MINAFGNQAFTKRLINLINVEDLQVLNLNI